MSCCARAGASLVAVTIVLVLAIVCMEGCMWMAVRGEMMEIAKRDKEEELLGGGNVCILGLASCWTRRTNIGGDNVRGMGNSTCA